jgi:N6-L-threonylcarbamoyladenine synthase
MRILSIETSCDETAISIIEATGDFPTATYQILGNALWSQVDIHREYGGVFPALAKREHARTLVPMLKQALIEAELLEDNATELNEVTLAHIHTTLDREEGLADALKAFLSQYQLPEIDFIAVTNGPGLEPALWVGISFAKALSLLLKCPVIPVNHMEGHVLSSIFDVVEDNQLSPITFPAIVLLISGGHTELLVMEDWGAYKKIGQTRDDAVGEAFDKVARLMGLPYPGGPEIGRCASFARAANLPPFKERLPRPMMNTPDLIFHFLDSKLPFVTQLVSLS